MRPILALHGWQDNLGTWTPLLPLLPRHIGVLCVDFPGHGCSSRYPKGMTYHLFDYVHTILSVMKTYQWEKVSLMGHSLGAVVAYIYASLYPNTIDLLIQIDIIKVPYRSPDYMLKKYSAFGDKLIVENERYDDPNEPPSYTFDELVERIHKGSGKSVNKENCKYLIERNCRRSCKDPNKLYFSRDPKIKFYVEFNIQHDYIKDFAKRIKNINHLVIKGRNSEYIEHDSYELMKLIKDQNPNFEFYELEGTHHVHMNSPEKVAEIISPFICKYRPHRVDEVPGEVKAKSKL